MEFDGRKKLSPEIVKSFYDTILADDEDIVCVKEDGTIIFKCNRNELLDNMFSKNLFSLFDENAEFIVKTSTNSLVLLAIDLTWWSSTRRRNKMSKEVLENNTVILASKKVEKEEQSYSMACATLQEGNITNISVFVGTKKDIIRFMNEQIQKRMVDSFLKSEPVFNLAYDESAPLLVEDWMTVDELAEAGIVTLV